MRNDLLQLILAQTWQIAVLAIGVAIAVRLFAKRRPHLAHALWMLVLLKCVTPPVWGHSFALFSQLQARYVPTAAVYDIESVRTPATSEIAVDANGNLPQVVVDAAEAESSNIAVPAFGRNIDPGAAANDLDDSVAANDLPLAQARSSEAEHGSGVQRVTVSLRQQR